MSPCFATLLGLGLGTYRRAGVPRGVCGEGGRLAWRSWAGAATSSLAPLHGHIEELELEEPCEERTVALQPPVEKKIVRRETLGPWGTPVLEPRCHQHHPSLAQGRWRPYLIHPLNSLSQTSSFSRFRSHSLGAYLVVQCLTLPAPTVGDTGWIPGQGTKIPHVTECGQKN